jgi:hypothetical protein
MSYLHRCSKLRGRGINEIAVGMPVAGSLFIVTNGTSTPRIDNHRNCHSRLAADVKKSRDGIGLDIDKMLGKYETLWCEFTAQPFSKE